MKVIELTDEQAEALTARAQAQGLTLEAWFDHLAVKPCTLPGSVGEAAAIILGEMSTVPDELMEGFPHDGAGEHDHYLYGWPKKGT